MTAYIFKTIKGLPSLIILGALALAFAAPSFADANKETAKDATATVEIAEVGASIVESADGLKVAKVTPASARAAKYRDVDIKRGDKVVSINGRRISTLAELRQVLATTKIGDQVRIGSLRSGGPVLAAYTVGSEEDLKVTEDESSWEEADGRKVVTVGGKPSGEGGPGERKMVTIKAGPGSVPLLDLGVILENVDGQVVVTQVLPVPTQIPDEARLKEKDVIKSIQGQKVADAADLEKQLQSVKAGESVSLDIARDGKDERLTFAMPKVEGTRKIITR